MKDEVLKIESSMYSFHLVDYRLKKIEDHIISLKNVSNDHNLLKDSHYFSSIYKYIGDAIDCQKINNNTIILLKKIVINIEVLL